ncbi:MAG: DUF4364 family protein [Oscillospiraceae bacterium]
MPSSNFADPEMTSVHSVKILLCYLLTKLDRPVAEEQLLEIAGDSGVINYFYLSEAIEDLLRTGAVSAENTDEGRIFRIEEKGRMGSDYFNRYIPMTFRRSILSSAYSYFAKIRRENECRCEMSPSGNGFSVSFSIGDASLELMKLSLYAPDEEQAEHIAEKIKRNPTGFYQSVIRLMLENPEEETEVDL